MPSQCAKSITVTFSGITLTDDFGFGDVNQPYSIKLSPHGGKTGCVYLHNSEANEVLVMVEVVIGDVTTVMYDLTRKSDLNNTQHVFQADQAGNVLNNSITENGGTATIS